jgi:hypothetical protein
MLYMGPAGTRSSRNLMLLMGMIGRPPELDEGEGPANPGGGEASPHGKCGVAVGSHRPQD